MSKKNKTVKRLCAMEFLQNADNVYRTSEFIVKQRMSISTNPKGDAFSVSEDTYYVRTFERDLDYEFAFQHRENLDGKRIKSGTYLRTYIF